ncbi:MAG: hypothetical protein G01um101438_153 [Parcubacteria group bacterium Gr01-1014_38]|nr:MAG: hypothetical protein G01um101438_153 [Parcubacteria group bacterium Gr01-1014_38]
MKILYTDEFSKQFRKLPRDIQVLYRRQEGIFRKNWRDPRLHVKKLHGESLTFSFRVTQVYRVLFLFTETDTALFATIGHRKDVYER